MGRQAWSLGPPTPLPPPRPRAPHPVTKPMALPLPAWQAAWPGPFSKEAHFLPLWAWLDEPGAPRCRRSYPSLRPHPRAGPQLPPPGAQRALPAHLSARAPRLPLPPRAHFS